MKYEPNKVRINSDFVIKQTIRIIEEEIENLADELVKIMKEEVVNKPDNPSKSAWYDELRDAIKKQYIRWDGDVLTAAVGKEMEDDGSNSIDGLSLDTMRALVVVYGMKEHPRTRPGEITYHEKLTTLDESRANSEHNLPDTWFHPGNDAIGNSMRRIESRFADSNFRIAQRIGREALVHLIQIERR